MFINITTPKFAAQAIKKNAEIGWKPVHFLNNVSASVGSVMKPAGFENGQDIISSHYLKDPSDRAVEERCRHEGLERVPRQVLSRKANRADGSVMFGYTVAQALVQVLKQCGDNLTRENVMKQAASLKDFEPAACCRASRSTPRATDFAPISQLQLMKFKGEKWELFGDIISADVGG